MHQLFSICPLWTIANSNQYISAPDLKMII